MQYAVLRKVAGQACSYLTKTYTETESAGIFIAALESYATKMTGVRIALKQAAENAAAVTAVVSLMDELLPSGAFDTSAEYFFCIPGMLYQYYIRDSVAVYGKPDRKTGRIAADHIASATELFTPDWIARYLLENSLRKTLFSGNHKPETVKVIDPCTGCGIMLVLAFDIMLDAYRQNGVPEKEAAASILMYNLYGTDIDAGACSIARFSLLLKAVQSGADPDTCMAMLHNHIQSLPEYGSLVDNFPAVSGTYDIVVTNPPYMASANADRTLAGFLRHTFPDSCTDLYAVFIERCIQLAKNDGYVAMLTQQSWMFLKRYRALREKIETSGRLLSVLHLGAHAFADIPGEVVQTAAFIFKKQQGSDIRTQFIRLTGQPTAEAKKNSYLSGNYQTYYCRISDFEKLAGGAYLYWASAAVIQAFAEYPLITASGTARQGIATGNNALFVRYWYEVPYHEIASGCSSLEEFRATGKKYIPYAKSSGYCRWFGNNLSVIRFDEPFFSLLSKQGNRLPSRPLFFHENINWTLISTDLFPARYFPAGGVCDVGTHAFYSDSHLIDMLGYMNTVVFKHFIQMISPTMNYSSGSVSLVPCRGFPEGSRRLAEENISQAEALWNMNELSPEFTIHPLVPSVLPGPSGELELQKVIQGWLRDCRRRIDIIKENTEALNRMYISLYGLERELKPEVTERYLYLKEPTVDDAVRYLISYSTGCMFGRYGSGMPHDVLSTTDLARAFTVFISHLYGEKQAAGNLAFIAEVLSVTGDSPEQKIMTYFENNFFRDHCRLYRGHPLYWPVGTKQEGKIRAYLYYHNYGKSTLTSLLAECRRSTERNMVLESAVTDLSEKKIIFDHDDGIPVNYKKLQSVLYCAL